MPAHRLVWEQRVGPLEVGMVLDHVCRNKMCVNPEHLEPVTRAENNRRRSRPKPKMVRADSWGRMYDYEARNRKAAATRARKRREALARDLERIREKRKRIKDEEASWSDTHYIYATVALSLPV